MTIGENIRQRRKAAGLRQRELANRLGVSQGRVSDLERGRTEPRLDTIRRLAAALGCTMADLLTPPDGG